MLSNRYHFLLINHNFDESVTMAIKLPSTIGLFFSRFKILVLSEFTDLFQNVNNLTRANNHNIPCVLFCRNYVCICYAVYTHIHKYMYFDNWSCNNIQMSIIIHLLLQNI